MELINELIARAKANKQRIVLPEGTEERTLRPRTVCWPMKWPILSL